MNTIKPVTPQELDKELENSFPDAVIEAFNRLLKENYRGKGSITIKQKDVVDLIFKLDESLTSSIIYKKNYLNIESLYSKSGWKVQYESPDRDQNFDSYFVFSKK